MGVVMGLGLSSRGRRRSVAGVKSSFSAPALQAAIDAERPAAALSFDLERVDVASIRRLLARAERFQLTQTAAGARWLLGEIRRAKARKARKLGARRKAAGVRA